MAPRISIDGVHVILWQMRGSNGAVRVVQQELAETLFVTKFTINRVLGRMVDEGRLELLSARGAVNTYLVKDPATWTP